MAFGTSSIDPGTSPTTGVAVDAIAGVQYQRTKAADPNEGSTGAYGIDTNPLRVRPRRRGTSDYDSGRVAVGSGAPASVTASTIYPEGGTVSNTHATLTLELTLTDGSDNSIGTLTIAPKTTIPLPVPKSGAWAGLKAGGNGVGLVLQVAGSQ
jgi:hypothetical protein